MSYSQSSLAPENQFISGVRIPNGENIDLNILQSAVQEECDKSGIPVSFRMDTLKTGGIFNRQEEDVLILYNPNHVDDYLKFLFRITHQGKYAFVEVFKEGGSKNYAHANAQDRGSTGRSILNALSGHSTKLREEEEYYTILKDCIQKIFV